MVIYALGREPKSMFPPALPTLNPAGDLIAGGGRDGIVQRIDGLTVLIFDTAGFDDVRFNDLLDDDTMIVTIEGVPSLFTINGEDPGGFVQSPPIGGLDITLGAEKWVSPSGWWLLQTRSNSIDLWEFDAETPADSNRVTVATFELKPSGLTAHGWFADGDVERFSYVDEAHGAHICSAGASVTCLPVTGISPVRVPGSVQAGVWLDGGTVTTIDIFDPDAVDTRGDPKPDQFG